MSKSLRFSLFIFSSILFLEAAHAECGIASVYWRGVRTASGERFNPDGISAAHKTLPFGTRVVVRNQRTGKSILVRINDRGPYVSGRIIDLSPPAARIAGVLGLAPVCVEVMSYGGKQVHPERVVRRAVFQAARFVSRSVTRLMPRRAPHRRWRHRKHQS